MVPIYPTVLLIFVYVYVCVCVRVSMCAAHIAVTQDSTPNMSYLTILYFSNDFLKFISQYSQY